MGRVACAGNERGWVGQNATAFGHSALRAPFRPSRDYPSEQARRGPHSERKRLRRGCLLARVNAGPSGMWLGLAVVVVRASDPTSQMRDVGPPARYGPRECGPFRDVARLKY